MDHVLVLYFKRHHHTEGWLDFLSYVIFYKFCSFAFYIRSMTHFELILVKNIRSVSRFFFFMGISGCSNTICQREYLCSIVLILLLVKEKLVIFMGSPFCSIDLFVALSPIPQHLDCCSFIVSLKFTFTPF